MNKTKIEWCDRTWNPVTGCLHGCEYCYARGMVRRFGGASETTNCECGKECNWNCEATGELHILDAPIFDPDRHKDSPYPFFFYPTFHRYRLDEPEAVKTPQNVFVCSMADLFGDWVPREWLNQVHDACIQAPQHRYLFLTKNPKRYTEFLWVEDDIFWLGTTVTTQKEFENWAEVFESNQYHHHYERLFLSIEPMQERIDRYAARADWIIIGAESGNRKDKVVPKREWIEDIVDVCKDYDVPIFLKNSLAKIWGEPLIQQFPWVCIE